MSKENANVSNVNESLTNVDWVWLDTVQVALDIPKPRRVRKLTDSLLLDAQLSPATRVAEERRLALIERKRRSLRKRKKYTRKRGTVHPKKKARTARLLRARLWATRPYSCVIRSWGAYRIEKSEWDSKVGYLWEKFLPEDLTVVRMGRGTRAEPYTIYDLKVVHKELGVLYDGNSEKLFDLSKPI